MDLLYINFTKTDLSKNGKENILVMTNAFSRFTAAVVMPNKKVKTAVNAIVNK